jgi:transcriptional regulator with XRE-family HTH domain
MSFTATDVGHRIALLRRQLGLSRVEFARRVGISRNTLLVYERSGQVPKAEPSLRRIDG